MNSSLNPEAPEFYPHLTSITQDGYTKVSKVIRSSHNWPSGASFELFKTITDFNIVSYHLSENVIEQTNKILFTESSCPKLKRNDSDYNLEKIIDANDNILDRVNMNMDTISGVNNPSQQFMQGVQSPVISKIKVGSTTFIGAKNIPRPQLMFKDTIDNSENLWVPKISDKPNSVMPLSLQILYDIDGNVTGYEHPYHKELALYKPSPILINPDLQPPDFPPPPEETKLTLVDTEEKLDELVQHLSTVDEIAIDLEHHSYRSYQGITCLMQISTNVGGDFIIDTLVIREHIHKLNVIFTDPNKLKVFHGAESDVLWLQRDFGVYIVGMFDTFQAAKVLGHSGLSLKHLLMRYCKIDADKTHQMADWRIRPLPDVLIAYARTDTHYLLYVWRLMKSELLKTASGLPHLLEAVFEASRSVCENTYNKKVIHEASHIPLYLRSKKNFTVRQMTALKMLYKWRDTHARELDESDQYLIPNHMLLKLSEVLPREVQGVLACCDYVPPFVKQNLLIIHKIILSCLELPNEPHVYVMPANNRIKLDAENQSMFGYNFHDMSQNLDFCETNVGTIDYNRNILESYYFKPDIKAFTPDNNSKTLTTVVSDLNADADMFFPPYDRYRKYRYLAQKEEIKDYKEREAKIIAIGKGNELIHNEVIIKLQQAQTQVAQEDNQLASTSNTAQRKRKISIEKLDDNETEKSIEEIKTDNASKTLKMAAKE